MPAAFVGGITAADVAAGAAVVGAGTSLASAASGGTSNSNAVAAASPFENYFPQYASQLAGLGGTGAYGAGVSGSDTISGLDQYVNGTTGSLTNTGITNAQTAGSQLGNLLANPSSITSSPGYQAALNQGLSSVESTSAAQGLNGSGNQLVALQNYGTSFEQNAYNTALSQDSSIYGQGLTANNQMYQQATGLNTQSYNQLAQLAGVQGNAATTAAGNLTAQGNVNTANATSGAITSLGTAANSLSGLGGSNNGYTMPPGYDSTAVNAANSGVYANTGIN
jgi:hypothetical protein